MGKFVVERNLKGISPEALAGAQAAAIAKSDGGPVSYVRSTFMPEDGRCFCLFEGPSAEAVKQVNDAAGLPYLAITPALDLPRPA
jgi:hypothetical protein